MVMPRLQMSDFTLYPFWLSSGFIRSGWKRDRQLRNGKTAGMPRGAQKKTWVETEPVAK